MFYNMFSINNDEVVSIDVVRKLTDLEELRDACHCRSRAMFAASV